MLLRLRMALSMKTNRSCGKRYEGMQSILATAALQPEVSHRRSSWRNR